jgi:hypothetical protein
MLTPEQLKAAEEDPAVQCADTACGASAPRDLWVTSYLYNLPLLGRKSGGYIGDSGCCGDSGFGYSTFLAHVSTALNVWEARSANRNGS